MDELAPLAVRAVEGDVELFAEASLVFGGHVALLLQLVVAVREGATIAEAALVS